jgi:DNA-binding beta-propeller fold protein YncE
VHSNGGEQLLIANDLADNALLIDAGNGQVIHEFDLGEHEWVPAEYPLSVVVSRDSQRAWISLWNASKVKELDLETGRITRVIELRVPQLDRNAGSHPSALLLSPDEKLLYCALSNADVVSVVDTHSGRVVQTLSTQLPQQMRPGVDPIALAQSPDGKHLYVADAGADAIAVFDTGEPKRLRPTGFIPTEWYPSSVAVVNNDLIVITAKGKGTGPNSEEWQLSDGKIARTNHPYILALLAGSVACINIPDSERDLTRLTDEVVRANQLKLPQGTAPWQKNPIRHVIYVIKENRSYDQLFGDIREANGDTSLVMYGEEITPNHHKLARQFGVLDNFYVSGEVSGDGHVWSTAATGSDYAEATVPIGYRNSQRTYDFEGTNLDEVVLEHGVPDISEPGTGYLWANAARHHISYREYGEYIYQVWCNTASAKAEDCPVKSIEKGQSLSPNVGEPHGSPNPFPWKVPVLARSTATKPELQNEFGNFVRAREQGAGPELPALIILKLPNDHTSGTRPGAPKPEAQLADNDLALGRIVEGSFEQSLLARHCYFCSRR